MTSKLPFLSTFLILSLICLLVFGLDSLQLLKWPKSAVYFLTGPVQFGIYRTSQISAKQFHFIFAARFAAQENKALQEQIGQIISENAELRRKLSESESLLAQENALDPKTYQLTPARPVGLDRYLRIDRGSNDGVKVGQAVVFKDNYLGKVVTVSEKSANVMLIVDPDSKISAFSFSKDGKAKGVLTGRFSQEMLLDKILHEEKIVSGDLVYSEGTEDFLPRGLILGQVEQVFEQENEVFKSAKVKPIFDIRDLELVFVINE